MLCLFGRCFFLFAVLFYFKVQAGEGRYIYTYRLFKTVHGNVLGLYRAVGHGCAVGGGGVEHLGILALIRNTEAVALSLNGDEVAEHDDFVCVRVEAAEDYDALAEIVISYPAESRPVEVLLPELGMVEVEAVQAL